MNGRVLFKRRRHSRDVKRLQQNIFLLWVGLGSVTIFLAWMNINQYLGG